MKCVKNTTHVVPAVARMHEILWHLHLSAPDGRTAGELCAALRYPRSSTYRLIRSMKDLGYVSESPVDRKLRLGPVILDIARAAFRMSDLVSTAKPHLKRLGEITGQTVKLSVERGTEVEVLDCVQSRNPFHLAVSIGARFPITAGAASKVLFAYQPEELVRRILSRELPRYTENTICDPDEMRDRLLEIRREAFAVDNEEHAAGVRAIAAPVFDSIGRCIAAVSIAYLSASEPTSSDLETWRIQLKRCTQAVTREL